MKSQEALEKIREGVLRFQAEVYPAQREKFERLSHGQHPVALFITCSDSRIDPNLLTQMEPGDLFIERNPGNLVPGYEEFVGGVSASVEYATLALKVPLVIVCGHTDCGVMQGLLHPERVEGLPAVRSWMRHALQARERLRKERTHGSDEEKLQRLTQLNVQLQIENLKTHPSVQARLAAGDLEIRGWVYDIGRGSGWSWDPETGQFRHMDEIG